MARKKRQNYKQKPKDADSGDDYGKLPGPDQDSEEYFNDEIEKFVLKQDKIMLEEGDEKNEESDEYQDDADEIMKLDSDDSDRDDIQEDDEEDIADEDKIEDDLLGSEDDDNEEADLPNRKAWGRKKKEFYDTNLKDQLANNEEEELAAEEEEKEALSLQQRMLSHLDQEDFDFFETTEGEKKADEVHLVEPVEAGHVVKDLSLLSKEEKIQILLKDSPELFVLLDDYQAKLNEIINKYHPLLVLARKGDVISEKGKEFIEVMHQLLLNYCVNISFYLALKAKKESVKDHPVIEKLMEYRNFISKLEPLAKQLESQMKEALTSSGKEKGITPEEGKSHQSKDLHKLVAEAKSMDTIISTSKAVKKSRKANSKGQSNKQAAADPWNYYQNVADKIKDKKNRKREAAEMDDEVEYNDMDEEADGKRAITYEMAKNKGLTRKRKKENRNPRVKHKRKFKKALIKRRSQVPMVRNEANAYGGEMSGIKSKVSKSVKIK